MPTIVHFVIFLTAFLFISLASSQIGHFFARYKLPLISGFLVAGLIAGPHVLGLVPSGSLAPLRMIDQTALAFIAFAAGAELQVKFVRGHIRGILTVLTAQTLLVMGAGVLAFMLLADQIPFMESLTRFQEILAVAIVASTIMVARSPSSAIAIIKEMRAKGKFTSMVLGATVLTDAVVIIVFATAVSVAAGLIEGGEFSPTLLVLVVIEILIDLLLGILVGFLLRGILSLRADRLKPLLVLALGYSVFVLSSELHGFHLFGIGLFTEPLLICMGAGYYIVNYTRYDTEFHHLIEKLSLPVFIAFFTEVGVSLDLDVLTDTWVIPVILVFVRFTGMYVGSLLGGIIAGDPMKHNLLSGFAYLTQAGVSVGLAKQVAVDFVPWGQDLATLSIGVIVINQLIGPPFFKWVLGQTGEAHPRADEPPFDGVRDAVIFGLDAQALALARQLRGHGWVPRIVGREGDLLAKLEREKVEIRLIKDWFSPEALQELELENADAIVSLLSDEESYRLCVLNYEHFGVRDFIVLLNQRENFSRFHELGALIVDPSTAIVSLLDQLVRSPVAASLVLGRENGQEIMDVEVSDPDLNGVAIRDLRLPADVLIISVHRDGHPMISLGDTRLYLGDEVTIVGSRESVDEVMRMFD